MEDFQKNLADVESDIGSAERIAAVIEAARLRLADSKKGLSEGVVRELAKNKMNASSRMANRNNQQLKEGFTDEFSGSNSGVDIR